MQKFSVFQAQRPVLLIHGGAGSGGIAETAQKKLNSRLRIFSCVTKDCLINCPARQLLLEEILP